MSKVIHEEDLVEVLPGCAFRNLVYSKGVVQQSLASGLAVVSFLQQKRCTTLDDPEPIQCYNWLIPFDKLRVLDSPHDNNLGNLEDDLMRLEDNLVSARSCLIVSEELREQQHDLIKKLVQEIDKLKAELYHFRGF